MNEIEKTVDLLDKSIDKMKELIKRDSINDEFIEEFLKKVAYNHYPQGDSHYAYKVEAKKGNRWSFGSSNDYPMQHGDGYKFEMREDLIKAFIKTK